MYSGRERTKLGVVANNACDVEGVTSYDLTGNDDVSLFDFAIKRLCDAKFLVFNAFYYYHSIGRISKFYRLSYLNGVER